MSIHPGEILLEEFLKPYGLTPSAFAKEIDVAPNRITAIINGERGITSDTALLLGEAFKTTAQFWTNLQAHYELELAQSKVSPKRMQKARELSHRLEMA